VSGSRGWPACRPNIRAALVACASKSETRLQIEYPNMIRTTIGVDLQRVAAQDRMQSGAGFL